MLTDNQNNFIVWNFPGASFEIRQRNAFRSHRPAGGKLSQTTNIDQNRFTVPEKILRVLRRYP
jgi:hypothetical protein